MEDIIYDLNKVNNLILQLEEQRNKLTIELIEKLANIESEEE